MVSDLLEIHIISDSTGDTAARVARAAQSQFGDSEIELHRHARVKSREQLARSSTRPCARR
jgi:regulator of PEP synthase PpsR (kinase-PPPase family)